MELTLKNPLAPVFETVKTGKNIASIGALVGLYTGSALLGKARIRDPNSRLKFFSENIGKYTRQALNVFNFEVETIGFNPQMMNERNFLLVSNHMSYLDIMVLSSVLPCVFVTSVDMGEQFFLGDMAELGGSIFIERRHRAQVGQDIGTMAKTLKAGHHVVIYPEGTSTNGEKVLPFKKSLLMSAVEAERDILPVVLKYKSINGSAFSEKNRDKVCWYGDMTFVPHLLGLMSLSSVKVELHFLDPIRVERESTRHDLAEKSYQAISQVYGQPFN